MNGYKRQAAQTDARDRRRAGAEPQRTPHPHRQQWGSRAAASLEVRLGVLGLSVLRVCSQSPQGTQAHTAQSSRSPQRETGKR